MPTTDAGRAKPAVQISGSLLVPLAVAVQAPPPGWPRTDDGAQADARLWDDFQKGYSDRQGFAFRRLNQGALGSFDRQDSTVGQQGCLLLRRLLRANHAVANFSDTLARQYPAWRNVIEQLSRDLDAWGEPPAAQRLDGDAQLVWPQLQQLPGVVAGQAALPDRRARLRVAVDLAARLRLRGRAESYRDIEQTFPALTQAASTLAASIKPDEYALMRFELQALPVADANRIHLIRNLAIDVQELAGQSNLRNQIHNNASPANVAMAAEVVAGAFCTTGSAAPSVDAIAALMQLRRCLRDGDRVGARAALGAWVEEFAGSVPDLGAAVAALLRDDIAGPADAAGSGEPLPLKILDAFVAAHVRTSPDAAPPAGGVAPVVLGSARREDVDLGPVDIFDKITHLYSELRALYDPAASVDRIEDLFAFAAPAPVRLAVVRAITQLRTDRSFAALEALTAARERCRELITSTEVPPAWRLADELQGTALGDRPGFASLVRSIKAARRDVVNQLDSQLSHLSAPSLAPSIPVVSEIKGIAAGVDARDALACLNDFLRAAVVSDRQALARAHRVREYFAGASRFEQLETAAGKLITGDSSGEAIKALVEFLSANAAEVTLRGPGLLPIVRLQPPRLSEAPHRPELMALENFIEACRAGDAVAARAQAYALRGDAFRGYDDYWQYLGRLEDTADRSPALAGMLAEAFVRRYRSLDDPQVVEALKTAFPAPMDAALIDVTLRLRAALRNEEHIPGKFGLALARIDAALEDAATAQLARICAEVPEIRTPQDAGAVLVALRGAIEQAHASGFDDLVVGRLERVARPYERRQQAAHTMSLAQLAEALGGLAAKQVLGRSDMELLVQMSKQAAERVWAIYQQLKHLFEPRLRIVEREAHIAHPAFVDGLIKQTALTHLKALADRVHAWAIAKLGQPQDLSGVVQNPRGLQVLSEGRALLRRIVIADSVRDLPAGVDLDEGTLLVLRTVGSDNITMAGSLVVNRDVADGSGAGGQFSHIFVWTRNMGIAGVSFDDAVKTIQAFERDFADALARGEEIYLEATADSFRLAPASIAAARGWYKQAEAEALRPGISSFVQFMVPDGAGGFQPDPDSMNVHVRRDRPPVAIEIVYPMEEIDGLGGAPLTFAELGGGLLHGCYVDALVGPKAGVLARLSQRREFADLVLPGLCFPFGQVGRILRQAGVAQAVAACEPALAQPGHAYWQSRFVRDRAYRAEQCAQIRAIYRERLVAALLTAAGEPTPFAQRELVEPLRRTPGFTSADGGLVPVILRSSANAEDVVDFNAAGKHKSVANVTTPAGVVRAFIDVVASLWNDEAVENRCGFGVDSRPAAMSVLAQPMIKPDASGVLVTVDSFGGRAGVYNYQATKGLFGGVHGAAQIQVAELGPTPATRAVRIPWRAPSAADPAGNLLSEAAQQRLFELAGALLLFFREQVHPGKAIELDIEFAVAGDNVRILQARPLPQRVRC